MPHHLDLYVRRSGLLHALDSRAKLLAAGGFIVAVALAPSRPLWPFALFAAMLLAAAALARVPVTSAVRRFLSLTVVIGMPFLLSRLGNEATRSAGEQFAVRSLLAAGAFLVLLATTRALTLLEILERRPVIAAFGQMGEFILRGADLLAEEVLRTNRGWRLRAPTAGLRMRLLGLTQASVSLIARAAARSERVGAAMVLRGFGGTLPSAPPAPLRTSHLCAGALFALASLAIAGAARWL